MGLSMFTHMRDAGAARFPFGTVVLSDETLSAFEEEASVLYVGGSAGDQLTLLMTRG